MPRVLVLGAGELGLPILHSLSNLASTSPILSRPTITLLVRPSTFSSPSPSKSRELAHLRDLGVSFLAADIATSHAIELASHFKHFDIIVSCTGFAGGPGTQLKLARAACEAGVAHYYPWQFGVDYDIIGPDAANGIFREQCEVRLLLRGQEKTKWTIVSTGMFTSFLLEAFFGVVEGLETAGAGGEVVVTALGGWENKVTVTTPEDIGRVVSSLVLADQRTGVVFTAGDTVSYGRLADLVEAKIGKKVRREVWSLDFLRAELETDPENQIKKYRCLFAEGKGVSWERASTVNEELNIKTTDVQGFLSSNASAA
ncbi:MAG: hypothetical protein L6R38_003521 [Xanthoria sp. 2 TBL-2021]|nr:MAG: hypothetical protein L6R38_003521 [Xanthoria sp. 2 TBL-2021]